LITRLNEDMAGRTRDDPDLFFIGNKMTDILILL